MKLFASLLFLILIKRDEVTAVYARSGFMPVVRSQGSSECPTRPPSCGGQNQSPINIDTSSVVGRFPWKNLGFHGYELPRAAGMTLTNDGRKAVLRAEGPFVMGGNLPLNEQFVLWDVVFHWGSPESAGSEHTVDGCSFAGEIHLIHYNGKYGSFESAQREKDGLVYLSTFLQISQCDNENLNPIIDGLKNIQAAGTSTGVKSFPLYNLLPANKFDFFRYQGSETHYCCAESVTWTIFKDPINISYGQIQQFFNLKDEYGNNIINNIRPVQNLNGRNVSDGQESPSWSYYGSDGQDVWASKISPDCGGMKQSPVAINTALTVPEFSWSSPLILNNFNTIPESMTLQNTDHGASIETNSGFKATIVGGPFQTPYVFFHYHFHWGSPSSSGSEHTVDGRRYAGEIHMLIYKESLGGLGPALGVKSGFLEVAVFLELSQYDNPKLDSVVRGFEDIVPSMSKTNITPFPLENLLPSNLQDYYYYDGGISAPVPTCNELIDFMIFRDPIPISRKQLSRFYNIENAAGYKIVNIFRQLQNLNGRTIFKSP